MQCRTILLHPSMTSELYLWFDRISSWGDSTAEIQSPKIGDWGPFLLRTNWRCAQKSTVFKSSLTKPLNFIAEIILLLFNFFVISWFYYTETIKFSSMFRFRKFENDFLFPLMVFGFFPRAFREAGGIEWIAAKIGFPLFAVGGSGENSQSNKSPHRPLVNFPNLAAFDQIGFWGFHISSLPHLQSYAHEMVWWKTFQNKVYLERLRLAKNAGINWLEDQIWLVSEAVPDVIDENRSLIKTEKFAPISMHEV